jgi:hypothetical protein
MPLWLLTANVGLFVLFFGLALALGFRALRERVLRPNWKRRHLLEAARDRIRAEREAQSIRGPERREALRWRAYWLAREIGDYGTATDDSEMRLFSVLLKEVSMTFVNPMLMSPRRRLDRLRDSVEFVAPYLVDEDCWWRSADFNREQARVIYWQDIESRRRARGQPR